MSESLSTNEPPVLLGTERGEFTTDVTALQPRKVVAGWNLIHDLGLLLVWVGVSDWMLYQVGTYASWGAFFMGSTLCLLILKRRSLHKRGALLCGILLTALSVKLIWCGSSLLLGCGLFLALCYAMSLNACAPFLPESIGFIGLMLFGAVKRMSNFRLSTVSRSSGTFKPVLGAAVLLPIAIVCLFATLFVLANPDLAQNVAIQFRIAANQLTVFLRRFGFGEAIFWIVGGSVFLGLLYPAKSVLLKEQEPQQLKAAAEPAPLYYAYRNTLFSVIVLFAIYLIFEFSTLWFREFPDNFYYAGYAHQGAFWLTVALALATLVLSTMFQGRTLSDSRLFSLKCLALVWSILNLLLSAAVYHRLQIYIEFNGLTRMRVIGLLGISCVVAGFCLVVLKLWRDHGFVWLVHRQLWIPALATVLYAILPVDWLVHRFNTQQVLHGNLAPSVQIAAQVTTSEGMLPLIALIDCQDETIRDGIRALMALWWQQLNSTAEDKRQTATSAAYAAAWHSELGHTSPWLSAGRGFTNRSRTNSTPRQAHLVAWQNLQLAEQRLSRELVSCREKWEVYLRDEELRDQALNEFFKYSFQWY